MVEQALQADPGLMRMRSEIQELSAQIDSQKSTFWPDLHLSMTQRHGDVTGRVHQIAIGFESKWGAGLSQTAALQVLQKRLEAKEADAQYRTSKLAEQIQSEKLALETARIKTLSFQRALDEAKAVAESWDRQFVAGKKSWQDVMNAVRESTQIEIQLVDIQGAAAASDLRLSVLALGVDWVQQHLAEKK